MNGSGGAIWKAGKPPSSSGASAMSSRNARRTVPAVLQLVEDGTAVDVLDRTEPEFERCHRAEVAAAAADGPEQVVVFVLARDEQPAVRGHHIGRDQVVAGQAQAAGEVSDAATEGESRDAGGGDDPTRGRQTERARRRVEVAPGRAAVHPRGPSSGIDADAPHAGQIGHHAVVAGPETGHTVPTPTHRQVQPVVTREVDRGQDIARMGTPHHGRREAVDHAVVDLARLVVAIAVRSDHRPPYAVPQPFDR